MLRPAGLRRSERCTGRLLSPDAGVQSVPAAPLARNEEQNDDPARVTSAASPGDVEEPTTSVQRCASCARAGGGGGASPQDPLSRPSVSLAAYRQRPPMPALRVSSRWSSRICNAAELEHVPGPALARFELTLTAGPPRSEPLRERVGGWQACLLLSPRRCGAERSSWAWVPPGSCLERRGTLRVPMWTAAKLRAWLS